MIRECSVNKETGTNSLLESGSPHVGGGQWWGSQAFQSKEIACASLEARKGIRLGSGG